jgi:hypothetical protein
MSKFFKRAFIFAVCFFLVNSLFAIQIQTGEIIGKVTDATGAPLPGVVITAKSPGLQGIRTAVTDRNGDYRFPLLPIGEYSLTFELAGFERTTQTGYDVRLGFTASIDVALELATVQETITVTSESPLLDIMNTDTSYRGRILSMELALAHQVLEEKEKRGTTGWLMAYLRKDQYIILLA